MSVIKVRFVTGGGFVSRSIRAVTGSLFSHVEFGTPENTWIGAHIDGGIQERPFDYCAPTREHLYEIPCKPEQLDSLMAWCRGKIGTKYNTLDIIGLLLKNRTLHTPGRFICSQFCTEGLLVTFGAYRVINCQLEFDYLITPETLHLSPIFVGNLVRKYER